MIVITSITTEWLSQLLQNVEANNLWSWGEAKKIWKIQNSVKNKIVVQICWTHVRPERLPAGAPGWWCVYFNSILLSRSNSTVC